MKELYDLSEVTFTVTGLEATMLLDILTAELRKSNAIGRTAVEHVRDKLQAGAMTAMKASNERS